MSPLDSTVPEKFAALGLTFDDVLLLPGESDVIPSEVDATSRLSRNVTVRIPLLSAAMDTVTEARMAIAMARQGGLAILNRSMSIDDQARQADGAAVDQRHAPAAAIDSKDRRPGGDTKMAPKPELEAPRDGQGLRREPPSAEPARDREQDHGPLDGQQTGDHQEPQAQHAHERHHDARQVAPRRARTRRRLARQLHGHGRHPAKSPRPALHLGAVQAPLRARERREGRSARPG